MFAVYFTGCTDSFLQALFVDHDDALNWIKSQGRILSKSDGGAHVEKFNLIINGT